MKEYVNDITIGIVIALIVVIFSLVGIILLHKQQTCNKSVLINAWKKEYLIPRNAQTRNFIMLYLLEFHNRSVNIKQDIYYQFWQQSSEAEFDKRCRMLFEKTKHINSPENLISELKEHLSQIILYRCYYQPNIEAQKTIAKHNIAVQEMQYDQQNDKQFFKRIFRLKSVDSLEFQTTIDAKLSKASNSTIKKIIDHL